jgi:hypothetical protein
MNKILFKPDIELLKNTVFLWHNSLVDPVKAQEKTLEGLLKTYCQTDYGRIHNAEQVSSYKDYVKAFPVQSFSGYKPLIDQVLAGNVQALLNEEPIWWKVTKGTTGERKLFPYISTQDKHHSLAITRIFYDYALLEQNLDWMSGYRLSLNSSGNLGTIKFGDRVMPYGYSIGVGMLFLDQAGSLPNRVTPTQEEIDTIPGESSNKVWEARYELAYQKAHNKNITHIITSHNVLLGFGDYIYRKYKVHPKDLWEIKIIMTSSFPGANTRYAKPIKELYGKSIDIRDFYVSTEGIYGGQMDEKKAWAPFYDFTFFEVQTINGIKPLYEMTPGEIGSLIVSTNILPRYRIGDLILAFEAPYFRCIGRENTKLNPYNFGKLSGKSPFNFPKPNPQVSWR